MNSERNERFVQTRTKGGGVGSDVINLAQNPTAGNATKLAVHTIAAGAAFIPVVGWGLSLGIGVADAIWGDQFYNWIDKK